LTEETLLVPIDSDSNSQSVSTYESPNEDQPNSITKNVRIMESLDNIYDKFSGSFNPYRKLNAGIKSSTSDSPCIVNKKVNILVAVSCMRTLAACAGLMSSSYRIFLGITAVPVMQHAGSPKVLVSAVGREVLEAIGTHCGYSGAKGLVTLGVNQYWYPLSMQLKAPATYPNATQALQVS